MILGVYYCHWVVCNLRQWHKALLCTWGRVRWRARWDADMDILQLETTKNARQA